MKKKELNILINSFTYRKLPLLDLVKKSKNKIDKKKSKYFWETISHFHIVLSLRKTLLIYPHAKTRIDIKS